MLVVDGLHDVFAVLQAYIISTSESFRVSKSLVKWGRERKGVEAKLIAAVSPSCLHLGRLD